MMMTELKRGYLFSASIDLYNFLKKEGNLLVDGNCSIKWCLYITTVAAFRNLPVGGRSLLVERLGFFWRDSTSTFCSLFRLCFDRIAELLGILLDSYWEVPFPLKDTNLCKHRRILDPRVDLFCFGHISGRPYQFSAGAFDHDCFPILESNLPGCSRSYADTRCFLLPICYQILLDVLGSDGLHSFADDLHSSGDLHHSLHFHDRDRDHGHDPHVHVRDRVSFRDDLRLNNLRFTFFLTVWHIFLKNYKCRSFEWSLYCFYW